MHLLIPFAAPLPQHGPGPATLTDIAPGGAPAAAPRHEAFEGLALPHLALLLQAMGEPQRDSGEETSLSPPHERVLAQSAGLVCADGLVPTAAWQTQALGLKLPLMPSACLTPAHWRLGAEQVALADPEVLQLDETESQAFLEVVRPLFESEGYALHYASPLCWLVQHESLAALPCAALDRVIGRHVDGWMLPDPRARRIRRLQMEVQMVLYGHALNEAREARGAVALNSFWLSGCGDWPLAPQQASSVEVDARLRGPALAQDWPAWRAAWVALDAGPLAQCWAALNGAATPHLRLSLSGERDALSWQAQPRGTWTRWRDKTINVWRQPDARAWLETL